MPEQKGGTGQNGEVKSEGVLSAWNAGTAAATTTRVASARGARVTFSQPICPK